MTKKLQVVVEKYLLDDVCVKPQVIIFVKIGLLFLPSQNVFPSRTSSTKIKHHDLLL